MVKWPSILDFCTNLREIYILNLAVKNGPVTDWEKFYGIGPRSSLHVFDAKSLNSWHLIEQIRHQCRDTSCPCYKAITSVKWDYWHTLPSEVFRKSLTSDHNCFKTLSTGAKISACLFGKEPSVAAKKFYSINCQVQLAEGLIHFQRVHGSHHRERAPLMTRKNIFRHFYLPLHCFAREGTSTIG